MSRALAQAVRSLAVAVLLAASLWQALPAQAADAPDKPVSKAEVDQLIHSIEDPDSRARLVSQLKLMTKADQQANEDDEPTLLSLMTEQIGKAGDEAMDVISGLADVGHAYDWIILQFADPVHRALWTEVLGKFAVLFAAAFAAERALILAFRPLRRLLEGREAKNRWMRLPLMAGIWVLEVLPLGLFIFVAHGLRALPSLTLDGDPKQATVLINLAYVLTRFVLVSVQVLLLPANASSRPLPLDDETASYLSIWARRLTLTGVWGYFAIQALKLLGLPKSAYGLSLKTLGLVVAALLVILVLQNRQAVADWIRSRGKADSRVQPLRERLADVWHVLACLYIAGAFGIWALQVRGGFEFLIRASLLTVLVLAAANALATLGADLVGRAFAINDDLRRRFPDLETRANRYVAVLQNLVRGLAGLAAVVALLQVWGVNALGWFGSDLGRRLMGSLLSIGAVIVMSLLAWELVSAGVERYLSRTDADGNPVKRSARARTLLPLLRTVVLVVLSAMVTLMVLSELGVNIAPLLAGAGVVGVAIGFGSQKLVQDVITGAFILFEDTIAVGDSVKIGDNVGTVEGLTIRTIRLRAGNGQLHTLPFSSVSTVINMSRDFAYHTFEISVAYNEDVDRVIEAIREVGDTLRGESEWAQSLPEPIEVFGVDNFDGASVVIRGRLKAVPGMQAPAGREFNRRLKKMFDEIGVEMPSSSTTLVLAPRESEALHEALRLERLEAEEGGGAE
ncbi:MAG TPA: mechanosensitive ion channel domain-containing protein [Candidatus Sulfotelmatobacter sp.]|jgi:small conductance mechanosensitive channel|nr:mechanosensitive ion channel domain-containing protein [Candidatus Sulfotelmatobacter sp.]